MNNQRISSLRESNRLACGGFTLTEIGIALGLFAFAIVPVIGLLQTGMSTFRDTIDRSKAISISNRLMDEIAGTSFSDLPATDTTTFRRFDNDAREVTNPSDAVYVAMVEIFRGVPMPNVSAVNNSALRVRIRVVKQPANTHEETEDWWDGNAAVQEFVQYVPRSDTLR